MLLNILVAKNIDFHIFTLNNKSKEISPKALENAFKSENFFIAQNANIQHELLSLFNVDNFHIYSHISFYHKDITFKLLKKEPKAGILAPMGVVMYQSKNDDNLYIIVPKASMQAGIIGLPSSELENLESSILQVIHTLYPTAKYTNAHSTNEVPKEVFTQYSFNIEDNDFEDAKEELEENFEELFEEAGFAMPSYFDFTDKLGEDSPYDFYVTYAICKLKTLKNIAKLYPESAALGPCTTIIYKKKDENKIVIGFASLHNWLSSANIKDKDSIESLLKAQDIYAGILKEVTK